MDVEFRRVDWPFKTAFRISRDTRFDAETVVVELSDGGITARGEGLPITYHGESCDSMLSQLSTLKKQLARGVSREELTRLLPAGGARNAVDCALWDLEAKQSGRRAWDLAGIGPVQPLETVFTLSLDEPAAMTAAASAVPSYSHLKLKLGGHHDLERVTAVRAARPDADIVVDANQAWTLRELQELAPRLAELGVKLIEQPLPANKDDALAGFKSPVPICADEVCATTEQLPSIVGKYDYVNIKLDKAGGLTEAVRLARAAQAAGLKLMVGCMAGTSLSMAPAFIVGQLCSVVDLDGPLLSATDVPNGIRYEGCRMFAPEAALWG